MKRFVENPKSCLITMISLIVICEFLLKASSMVIQFFGICLLPFIILLGLLLMTNDKKKNME